MLIIIYILSKLKIPETVLLTFFFDFFVIILSLSLSTIAIYVQYCCFRLIFENIFFAKNVGTRSQVQGDMSQLASKTNDPIMSDGVQSFLGISNIDTNTGGSGGVVKKKTVESPRNKMCHTASSGRNTKGKKNVVFFFFRFKYITVTNILNIFSSFKFFFFQRNKT